MSYELLFTTLLLFISTTRSQETIVKLGAFSHLVQYIRIQPNFFAMIEKDGNVIARDDLLNREYGSKDPEIMCNRLEETQKDNYKTCWSITCDEEYSLIGFGNGLTRGYSNELISRHMNNNMQGVWLSLFKDIKPQNKIFEFTKNILIHNIDHTKLVNQLLLSLDQYKNLIKLFLHGVTRYKK